MSHADGYVELSQRREPIAAKQHTCCACAETIQPGHRYVCWFVVSDGEAGSIKQCWRCSRIWDAIAKASPREPILFTLDCGESWSDVFGECPPELEALAFSLHSDFDHARPT